MKLVVFAHVPPPHHGQSYMVKLMLEGFGGDQRGESKTAHLEHGIACYHVNARLSTHLADIGDVRFGKLGWLVWYSLKAIWCRFRHGARNLYYVPAPGKGSALIRDWLVMTLCRPFFKRIILHWHAAGMAKWLETSQSPLFRRLTFRSLGQPDLCIVLSKFNRLDAEKLWSRRICVVGNGIPDPCPNFDTTVLPRRRARLAIRQELAAGQTPTAEEGRLAGLDPNCFHVLFLAHCTREKGLFDTLDGVALAVKRLAEMRCPISIKVAIAGEFISTEERAEFNERIARADLKFADGSSRVTYLGFVRGDAKAKAFLDADCFCFPTYYYAESFGLVLVEAMSFGLPIIASRWRAVPELFPTDYPGLVNPRRPEEIADKLMWVIRERSGELKRQLFVNNHRLDIHIQRLGEAIRSVEPAPDANSAYPLARPARA